MKLILLYYLLVLLEGPSRLGYFVPNWRSSLTCEQKCVSQLCNHRISNYLLPVSYFRAFDDSSRIGCRLAIGCLISHSAMAMQASRLIAQSLGVVDGDQDVIPGAVNGEPGTQNAQHSGDLSTPTGH